MTGDSLHIGGAGPDVVLLHGLGSRWQVFEPILEALEKHRRVFAFDLPGFGAEPPSTAHASDVAGLADWVGDRMAEHGIRDAHVVGSSLGAGVALELASRGVVARATAFAPIGFWGPIGNAWTRGILTILRGAAQRLQAPLSVALQTSAGRAMLLFLLFGRPAQVTSEAAIGDLAALAAAPGFVPARDAMRGQGPIDEAANVPTTIVWGRRDLILPFTPQARRARRAWPHARHVALSGAGHLPFSDAPSRCAALVLGVNIHPTKGKTHR